MYQIPNGSGGKNIYIRSLYLGAVFKALYSFKLVSARALTLISLGVFRSYVVSTQEEKHG
jgi:hypothetical protein